MKRILTALGSGIRRLVMGRRRDRQFDHPEAHRQEPDRYGRVAHIHRPTDIGPGGSVGN
ncbi:hypothetical protein ACIA8O_20455 [Kitasatospora sp. NPDC051853]|uniref:hypothetical protein n=1 Tax=Kitasatospora sp. NPDC051853 TaxID=3364058 RepID=UPI00379F42FA